MALKTSEDLLIQQAELFSLNIRKQEKSQNRK